MKLKRVATALTVSLALAGCGPALHYAKTGSAMERIEARAPPQGPVIDAVRPLSVSIEAAALGGVVVVDQLDGGYRIAAELHEVQGADPDPEVRAEYERLRASKRAVSAGVVAPDFGEVFAAALQRRLNARLPAATVRVGHGLGSDLLLKTTGTLDLGSSAFQVKLHVVATPGAGAPLAVDAEGTRQSLGSIHMAWAIPVMVLTFPIGLGVVSAIISGISDGHRSEAFALALDDAAAKLAEEIFAWSAPRAVPPEGRPP